MRIGPRHYVTDCSLLFNRLLLLWVQELKFLRIVFLSGHNFNFKLQVNKHNFFRAANGILGRVGSKIFTNVTLSMIDTFCVPVLLYGFEALDNKPSARQAINFVYNGIFVKLFNVKDTYNIHYCHWGTGCLPASCRLDLRLLIFFSSLLNTVETIPLASQLFYWCGDLGYEATLSKYGVPKDAKVTKKIS